MKARLKKITPSFVIRFARGVLSIVGCCFQKTPLNSIIFQDENHQVFFGYYDIMPFSNDDRYILAQRAPSDNVSPHIHHPELELGFYDLQNLDDGFHGFAYTDTWNWQQGCRLQWLFHHADQPAVIYNKREGDRYVSVIQNPFSKDIIKKLDLPIYSVSSDGLFALTLDFDRLHSCRPGYGYNHFPNKAKEDCIWMIDINSGAISKILAMSDVVAFKPLPSMEGANHYFNHLSINPSGTKFMVTHLWVSSEGKRYSRMIICDLGNNNQLSCPNNSGHTSHYCWDGDSKIVLFGTQKSYGQRYYLHDLENGKTEVIGEKVLTEDGHPTVVGNGTIITDTYPNLIRHQTLLRYDRSLSKVDKLATFHVPLKFTGEVRCDLHPRINSQGNKACVDIVRNKRRAMCLFDISKE